MIFTVFNGGFPLNEYTIVQKLKDGNIQALRLVYELF